MFHMVRPSLPVLLKLMATNDDEVHNAMRASIDGRRRNPLNAIERHGPGLPGGRGTRRSRVLPPGPWNHGCVRRGFDVKGL